ncbi:MAG: regulatory protein RecX [Rikenellaceae bacterium]
MCAEVTTKRRTKSAEQALSALMRECAKAEKSTGDARRLMARWEVPIGEREGVIERLMEMKFIDNRRFAHSYMRDKLNLSGWGAQRIRLELGRKGVEREIVDEVLSDLDRDAMQQRLETMLAKRLRTLKYKDQYDLKNKLMRYGASLGYDYSAVRDAIDQATQNAITSNNNNDEEWTESYF